MANSLLAPSAIIGLMGANPRRQNSLLPFPVQADELDELMFRRAPNGYVETPQGTYFAAEQQSAPVQPQASAQRERVSALNVLFRGLAPNLSGALDTERARLQREADMPQIVARQQENERIARALGPQALLAFRSNPEALGESLGYGYRPQVIGQGGIQSVAATGQRISAPQFDEFGNEYRLNDPLTQTSTVIGTRGPSYAEQAQFARVQADQAQADARLNLDYQRLGQDQQQFDQRLSFDQSKQEARPLSAAQSRQLETYLQDIDAIGATNSEIDRIDGLIASGSLDLGPAANLSSRVRNATGLSNENSRNFAEFQATVQKVINDSLRLNKGVQTEGDAQRAATEILRNPNDEGVVRAQLRRLRALNERAIRFREGRVGALESGQYIGGRQGAQSAPPPPPGFVLD